MALGTLLLYSLFMFAAPLGTFFSISHGLLDSYITPALGQEFVTRNRLSLAGGLSVIAVNIVLGAFIVAAWREPVAPKNHKED